MGILVTNDHVKARVQSYHITIAELRTAGQMEEAKSIGVKLGALRTNIVPRTIKTKVDIKTSKPLESIVDEDVEDDEVHMMKHEFLE